MFIRENPNLKWMMTGCTPSLGNLQIGLKRENHEILAKYKIPFNDVSGKKLRI